MTDLSTFSLIARFCTRLRPWQKEEIAKRLGIARAGGRISNLRRDQLFLIAVQDAGKLDRLSAYLDEVLFPPIDNGISATLAVIDEAASRHRRPISEQSYLVWSNEHRAWWKPDEQGYTRIIERAGRYTRADALQIAGKRGGGWQAESIPYEIAIPEADAIAQYAGSAS